ncbi:G1 family glutamic endopeptidase [Falsiroseomonas oryzae]|uniref:G1 family glutamic endopeptidase n=1 Tax=Falsiroseomonas oryzae TaxID=2766473 RepID=UPI0022EAA6C7|nr:G1 family glutamic endopeptidase [Roseomonas sp. MO-31]
MGDIIAAADELLAAATAAVARRAERLPALPAGSDAFWGDSPDGYDAFFVAGGGLPWPYPDHRMEGAAWMDLAARWKRLRRTRPSGAMAAGRGALLDRLRRASASNAGGSGPIASRREASRNWSGAILGAREGCRFTAVTARWRVPDAAESAPGAPAPIEGAFAGEPLSRRVSVWIGLDGHRDIAGSLPQIGTTTAEMFRDGRRWVETYAWAQWWVLGGNYGEVVFTDFAVRPGDEVACWLALHSPERVVMSIRNETRGTEDSVAWQSGPIPAGGGRADLMQLHARPAPVDGMAAVWCVERPTVMGRTDKYPLPDFGQVEFRDCIAGGSRQGPHDALRYAAVDMLRTLDQPRLVSMTDRRGTPCCARRIAVPDRGAARDRLVVQYRG